MVLTRRAGFWTAGCVSCVLCYFSPQWLHGQSQCKCSPVVAAGVFVMWRRALASPHWPVMLRSAKGPRAALVASLHSWLIFYAFKYQARHAFVQPPSAAMRRSQGAGFAYLAPLLWVPPRHTFLASQVFGLQDHRSGDARSIAQRPWWWMVASACACACGGVCCFESTLLDLKKYWFYVLPDRVQRCTVSSC